MARKTIKNAVEELPKNVADHIVRMFNIVGYIDCYEGDLEIYLKLIEQATKLQADRISRAEGIGRKIHNYVMYGRYE